jgi:hypothetical protein
VGSVIVGVPFAVGVGATVVAIQQSAGTQEAEGTVVGFRSQRPPSRGGNTGRKPVVEYHVAGKDYQCIGGVSSNLPIHAVGDTVTVRYKTDEPSVAFIDSFFDRWLCPLAFTGGGFFFLVLLSVAAIRQIKRPPATVRRRRSTSRHR